MIEHPISESAILKELSAWTLDMYRSGVASCPYCGRSHITNIDYIDIFPGAIEGIGERLNALGAAKPLIVADPNTYRAAGEQVRASLAKSGIDYVFHILSDSEPIPDEATAGDILMSLDPRCDFVLGVGSGVVNDLCRFVSCRTGRRFGIVATAPSMDGFASTVAPLIRRSLKTTFQAQAPALIIGDADILAQAPSRLLAAGYADVVGKLNSLVDWKIARIVVDEYYCPWVSSVMRRALDDTLSCADGLASGEPMAASRLMEALTLAGVAMTYAGNSRPASGFEHHLAHAWEMRFLREGRKLIPHGVKVGIGTVAAMNLAKLVRSVDIDWDAAASAPTFEGAAWEGEMRRVYGPSADGVIELENSVRKNSREKRGSRLASARAHWREIAELLSSLPSGEEVIRILRKVGSPASPVEIGLSMEAVRDGILYAKEVRDRFTQQQLAWDIGLLPGVAEDLALSLSK